MAKDVLTVAVFNDDTGWYLDERFAEQIRGAAINDLEVRQVREYNELLELLPDTTFLMSYPLTEDHLRTHAQNLRWIQLIASTGDWNVSLRAALEQGIRISTAAPIRAPQIAEHAVAMLLAMTRKLKDAVIAQSEHRWETEYLASRVREVSGSSVGVIGAWSVGQAVADRLHAFGADVVLFDPCPDSMLDRERIPHEVHALGRLDDQLPLLDSIVVACPFLPATDDLLNADRLARLKPSAMLVDVSKGGIVDEHALLLALRRGRMSMAALDVFETEPLAPTSPLWTMPDVILTPHVSAASPRYWARATEVVCTNLRHLRAGERTIDEATLSWYAPGALA